MVAKPISKASFVCLFTLLPLVTSISVHLAGTAGSKFSYTAAIYNGEDNSIYIFGGINVNPILDQQILRFNLTSSVTDVVGNIPNTGIWGKVVQKDTFGNIFYFGGKTNNTINENKDIYKYNIASQTIIKVGELDFNFIMGSTFKYNESSNTAYLMGGWGQYLTSAYNMETHVLQQTGHLAPTNPCPLTNQKMNTGGFNYMPIGSYNYAFGLCDSFKNNTGFVSRIHMDSLESEVLAQDLEFQLMTWYSPVSDGEYLYAFGAYRYERGGDATINGVYRFQLESNTGEFLPWENFPPQGDVPQGELVLNNLQAVYVEPLKRIYLVGVSAYDFDQNGHIFDSIWYLDLSDLKV